MNKRLAAAAVLLALAGCAKDKPASIEIYQTCAPPTPSATGGCEWPATCSLQPLGTYAIDVGGTNALFLGVQVNNQLLKNADAGTGHVNTNDAFVDTYLVDYSVHDGTVAIPSITGPVRIQNTVPASGSAVVGVNLMDLDSATRTALQSAAAASPTGVIRVTATMKLKGVLGDSSEFETGERIYGIDVCSGCISKPACGTQVPAACPDFYQEPRAPACLTPPT